MKIAVDGPAGSGKSTVSKAVAKRNHITYIDTGAMYRAITYSVLSSEIPIESDEKIKELLPTLSFDFIDNKMHLNGQDISEEIRSASVTRHVSDIAKKAYIRSYLVEKQRELAGEKDVIMDGRDIGTVVLPDAELKIFLVASIKERAQRRYLEETEKGLDVTLEEIEADIQRRDHIDSTRETSPLLQASDAIRLDTTGMNITQVVEAIESLIKEVTNEKVY